MHSDHISDEDLANILDHNRNILISENREEFHDGNPFVMTIGYLGPSSGQRAVELDGVIIPIIRNALRDYLETRNLPAVDEDSAVLEELFEAKREGQETEVGSEPG